jgi:hypothetical protein
MHSPLQWDEWYTPFIGHAYFLPLSRLINSGLSIVDFAALMTLINRWRLKTHTFHLSCGETTTTLQDVAMLLG